MCGLCPRADTLLWEAEMNWKKIITWLIVIFAVYTVLASPAKAADLVRSGFDGVSQGGHSVQKFFDALVQ
jgi:hypothetical protein